MTFISKTWKSGAVSQAPVPNARRAAVTAAKGFRLVAVVSVSASGGVGQSGSGFASTSKSERGSNEDEGRGE